MSSRKRSTEIPAKRAPTSAAKRDKEAEFQSLLRTACLKAAGVGAVSALAGAIPGAGTLLRFTLGEIADIAAITAIQEKLIEDTLTLYDLPMPEALRKPLIAQISALGAGASIGVDALGRKLFNIYGKKLGATVLGRVAPIASVLTSALGNASTTYAIGRRAQAFAKVGSAPVDSVADALRAFTGVDERKVWEWSVAATKETLGTLGGVLSRVAALNPFTKGDGTHAEEPAAEPTPEKPRRRPAAKKASPGKSAAKATGRKSAAKEAVARKSATAKPATPESGASARKKPAPRKRQKPTPPADAGSGEP
ncbi:hypothetical protein [Tahibacter amnicola]|uniref:DUF697 domain-containing protein n=1 Tax=Tahibacter amnicola TaxID=2976241 RepID=A0ABY6BJI3_9GAMM|nr:hypothetical protein [Tahibacter amnicola]UXI69751.1 hypothetical protein N4264_09000 [Tahibacter amnicola]